MAEIIEAILAYADETVNTNHIANAYKTKGCVYTRIGKEQVLPTWIMQQALDIHKNTNDTLFSMKQYLLKRRIYAESSPGT